MNEQACCFTGHRVIPEDKYPIIRERLRGQAELLTAQGVREFIAGGAGGFDTMAALTVLPLKEKFPDAGLKLILALPCRDQEKYWSLEDKKIYGFILEKADETVYISENYRKECMLARDRYMVDRSGVCVCWLTARMGGTAYTVRYARQKGLRIINLAARGTRAVDS